jgi:hypothetical protein
MAVGEGGEELANLLGLLFGSQGGHGMKPTKKDHMACKHMEMDLLVALGKETFDLQQSISRACVPETSEFTERLRVLCEGNAAFQRNLAEADRRAVLRRETLEMLRGLRRDLSSLKLHKSNPPSSLVSAHFKGKVYLEAGFSCRLYAQFEALLMPAKLADVLDLLGKHHRKAHHMRPEALREFLWRVYQLGHVRDSHNLGYRYPEVRQWLKTNYPELMRRGAVDKPAAGKALGGSVKHLRNEGALRKIVAVEAERYPLAKEAAELFRLIKARKPFGTLLYRLSPYQRGLLGEPLWAELKQLDFLLSRHLAQLETLDDLVESLQRKAAMGGSAERIWANLGQLSLALYCAVLNVPVGLPRNAVLSLWLAYVYARHPEGIESYYGHLSGLLGIVFERRPCSDPIPFLRTPMTMRHLEEALFTFDGGATAQSQPQYVPREEVDQVFRGIAFPVCVEEAIFHFASALGIGLGAGFEAFCQSLQNRRDLVYYSLIRGGRHLEPGDASEQHQFFTADDDGFIHKDTIANLSGFERGQVVLQAVYTQERVVFDTVILNNRTFMLFGDEDLPYEVAPTIANILRALHLAKAGFDDDDDDDDYSLHFGSDLTQALMRFKMETELHLQLKPALDQLQETRLVHANATMKAVIKVSPGHCHANIKPLLRVNRHDEILADFQRNPKRYLKDPILHTYLLYFIRPASPVGLHGLKGLLYRGKRVLLESVAEFLALDLAKASSLEILLQFPHIGPSAELLEELQNSPKVVKKLATCIAALQAGQFASTVLPSQGGDLYLRAYPHMSLQTRLLLLKEMPCPVDPLIDILQHEGKTLRRKPSTCRLLIPLIAGFWEDLSRHDIESTVDSLFRPFFEAARRLSLRGVTGIGNALGTHMDVVYATGHTQFVFTAQE